jgi:hypothetical protein
MTYNGENASDVEVDAAQVGNAGLGVDSAIAHSVLRLQSPAAI